MRILNPRRLTVESLIYNDENSNQSVFPFTLPRQLTLPPSIHIPLAPPILTTDTGESTTLSGDMSVRPGNTFPS